MQTGGEGGAEGDSIHERWMSFDPVTPLTIVTFLTPPFPSRLAAVGTSNTEVVVRQALCSGSSANLPTAIASIPVPEFLRPAMDWRSGT